MCDFPITINFRHVKFADPSSFAAVKFSNSSTNSQVQRLNLPVGLQEHPVIHAHFVRMFGLGRHQAPSGWGHDLPNGFSFHRLHLPECGEGGGDTWIAFRPAETESHVFLDTHGTRLVHHPFFWTHAMIAPRMVGPMWCTSSRPQFWG